MKFKTKIILAFAILSTLFAGVLIWMALHSAIPQGLPFLTHLDSFEKTNHPNWILVVGIVVLFTLIFACVIFVLWLYEQRMHKISEAQTRELKHQMTSNIAHELKTPVTSIRGYLETLVNNPDLSEENKRLFIERSYHQSLRLSELINDIALITKIEEAPSQFNLESVNLWNVSEEVFEELQSKLAQTHIQIENQLPQDLSINGNYNLLYAVFRNLVENSIKYSGGNCIIHLEAHKDKKKIYITYYDTGTGVPEEILKRIFDRFYRIQGQTGDGSGLGLAIVRNAVAFHGGWIQVFQHQPSGLQFEIAL